MGLHQTTVCKTIWFVAKKIAEKAKKWIKFPHNTESFEKEKNLWQKKFRFPSAIGAIDCTHVAIKRPSQFRDEYVNRKGVTTFNVQATCNASEIFTSVDCRWAGSVHDARIWRNSQIRSLLDENQCGAILLGDEAYPLTPWLMVPFRQPETTAQKSYNILHTKERVIIERVFGQIKQRFPILQSKIRMTTNRVPTLIIACFTLHNVAKYLQDEDFLLPPDDAPREQSDTFPVSDTTPATSSALLRGKRRRDAIAKLIDDSMQI